MAGSVRRGGGKRRSAAAVFTAERTVERMVAEGFPAALIAEKTGLSTRQVGRYAARIKARWSSEAPADYLRQAMARIVEDARSARGKGQLQVALAAERLMADLLGRRMEATGAKGAQPGTPPPLSKAEMEADLECALSGLTGALERGQIAPSDHLRRLAADLVEALGSAPADDQNAAEFAAALGPDEQDDEEVGDDEPVGAEVVFGSRDYLVGQGLAPPALPPAAPPPTPRAPRPPVRLTETVTTTVRKREVVLPSGRRAWVEEKG